jgi:N-acetyl-alpha-D-muramate 1-phosphate uridylyltransferase
LSAGALSLGVLFDHVIESAALESCDSIGVCMHVGTPEAVAAAETAILDSAA